MLFFTNPERPYIRVAVFTRIIIEGTRCAHIQTRIILLVEETIIAKQRTKLESKFQRELRDEIEQMLPGCITLKQDPSQMQGIPDLIIIHRDKWAMLECKRSATSDAEPNQPYYVDLFDSWSYAAFVYPENKEAILNALQQALQPRRQSRRPQR